ncbi:MAG TPA: DUF4249 family protein [Chitinophagaceae bacterium]|nr:DUF4249 family protein [Chitinophagaceae bacterium]
MKAGSSSIKILIVLLLMAGAFYISCTKPGDVRLPPHQPRLVLHSYTETGDTFRIALGQTFPSAGELVQPDFTFIHNGWAALYERGAFVDSLLYDSLQLRYVARHAIASAGKLYTIKAGAPGFPDVEAHSFAPAPVPLISLVRKKRMRKTSSGIWLDDMTMTFNDPAGESNFYLASVRVQQGYGPGCVYTYDPSVERYTTEFMAFNEAFCINSDAIMYTDRTFNGTMKELTISAASDVLDSLVGPDGRVHRPYITRYAVTEDYFKYYMGNADRGIILEEGPSFTTPSFRGGNVKNGYGLFTIYAALTDTIR